MHLFIEQYLYFGVSQQRDFPTRLHFTSPVVRWETQQWRLCPTYLCSAFPRRLSARSSAWWMDRSHARTSLPGREISVDNLPSQKLQTTDTWCCENWISKINWVKYGSMPHSTHYYVRHRGHEYTLSHIRTTQLKNTFVNRCLFSMV